MACSFFAELRIESDDIIYGLANDGELTAVVLKGLGDYEGRAQLIGEITGNLDGVGRAFVRALAAAIDADEKGAA